jgi:hypothetical protein
LSVSCELQSPLGVTDDWSPDLGALLERLWWDVHGIPGDSNLVSAPTLRHAPIPLAWGVLRSPNKTDPQGLATEWDDPRPRADLPADWHWCSSSPIYRYSHHTTQPIRRAWRPQRTRHLLLDDGAKWNSSSGNYKSYDLQAPGRCLDSPIRWHCVGNRDGIAELLSYCSAIGRNRKAGQGQIRPGSWRIEPVERDFSLLSPQGAIVRPVPVRLGETYGIIRTWCWRPPGTLREFAEPCWMPQIVRFAPPISPVSEVWQ